MPHESPPMGQVLQTIAIPALLAASVAAVVSARAHTAVALAAGASLAAYAAPLIAPRLLPDGGDVRAVGRALVGAALMTAIFWPHSRLLLLATLPAVAAAAVVARLGESSRRRRTRRLGYAAALLLMLPVLGALAWRLPRSAAGEGLLIRVALALLGLFPLVYLAGSQDQRDAWLAVLDVALVSAWLLVSLRFSPPAQRPRPPARRGRRSP